MAVRCARVSGMRAVGGRFICLWLAALVAACACGRSPQATGGAAQSSIAHPDEVRVHVTSVGFDQATGAHYVLLHDDGQARELPIMIGDNEAQAILLALHNIKPDRPLTHDLLRSVIEETGNRLDRILISDMRDEVFYAKLFLDKGRVTIDSRPSDAIALAMASKAPIYVNSKLFEDAPDAGLGMLPAGKVPQVAHALGMTVEQLTPELAGYFGAPESGGVLVSEVDAAAQKAGVARGDLVVKVGERQVKALDDFEQTIAAARNSGAVNVTIVRSGADRTVMLVNGPAPGAAKR